MDEVPAASADTLLAVGFDLVVNLGEARQITLKGVMPYDMPLSVRNDMLDGVLALADRQKARYEIETVEAELAKHRDTLSQMAEDRARIELDFAQQQARRQIELDERIAARDDERRAEESRINAAILDVQKRRQDYYDKAEQAFDGQGRRGSFKPAGQEKANLEKFDQALAGIAKSREADMAAWETAYTERLETAARVMHEAVEERDKALAGLGLSEKRYTEAIAGYEERLAKLCAQVGT